MEIGGTNLALKLKRERREREKKKEDERERKGGVSHWSRGRIWELKQRKNLKREREKWRVKFEM